MRFPLCRFALLLALAATLALAPRSARADSISEVFAIPAASAGSCCATAQLFDPALGVLNSVDLTVTGTVEWFAAPPNPFITFYATIGDVSAQQTFDTPGGITVQMDSGLVTSSAPLASVTGATQAPLVFSFAAAPGDGSFVSNGARSPAPWSLTTPPHPPPPPSPPRCC